MVETTHLIDLIDLDETDGGSPGPLTAIMQFLFGITFLRLVSTQRGLQQYVSSPASADLYGAYRTLPAV